MSRMTARALSPDTGSQMRRPRLMIAGEFSAGKTRLINGLLGNAVLPSNVTSTSLPPIWLTAGDGPLQRVDIQGEVHDLGGLDEVDVADTAYCVMPHDAPFLDAFDIIDTPGNSDPNIPAESWERMLGFTDAVIWCSNATQAWRQSEKAVWTAMPGHLTDTALMVVTHSDRMPDERSADRVFRRVRREAKDFFSSFLMSSLINDDHVAEVRKHIETVYGALEARPGASEPLVDAMHRAAPPKAKPENVATRSANKPAKPAPAHSPAPAARPKQDAAPTPESAPTTSPARQAWNEITDGVDTSKVGVLKMCIETMILQMDELLEQRRPTAAGSGHHKTDQAR